MPLHLLSGWAPDDDDDDADNDVDGDATPAAASGLQIWHEMEITIFCTALLVL